jgi:hypothetical protein
MRQTVPTPLGVARIKGLCPLKKNPRLGRGIIIIMLRKLWFYLDLLISVKNISFTA